MIPAINKVMLLILVKDLMPLTTWIENIAGETVFTLLIKMGIEKVE